MGEQKYPFLYAVGKSLAPNPWSPGIGVDGYTKASVKEDASPGCFPWCQQCCGSMMYPPAWSSNIALYLLLIGKLLGGVWSPWSRFRNLTVFANAELMQPCESRCALVSFLSSMSNRFGRRNARACLRMSCCIFFLTQMVFFFLPCISSFS